MDPSAWLPETLNLVDLLLVVVVLLGMGSGWRQGFVSGALSLTTLAASLLFALVFHVPVASWLVRQSWVADPWAAPVAFGSTLVPASLVLGGIARALMRRLPYRVHAFGLNRWLGLVPGAVTGCIHAAVVAVVLTTLPLSERVADEVRGSTLAERLGEPAERLEARLRPIFEPAVKRTMRSLTIAPESHESVRLPFSVARATPRPDLEAAMLVLVNEERVKAGLPALQADPQALDTARAHSRDMFARGYFSHIGPDGTTPFDRMRANGLRFRTAGENLALAPSLPMAHKGLMNSPGHRANILQPAFGRLAVGILDGGRHGLMVTQTFRN
ncbi:CvpA family protein [Variovorax sp. PvP013]|uniref:CvpA family protein n=1 Tax=Variovorax sp. PvP013 TaxID=3156435 RepID=UPI003D214C7D